MQSNLIYGVLTLFQHENLQALAIVAIDDVNAPPVIYSVRPGLVHTYANSMLPFDDLRLPEVVRGLTQLTHSRNQKIKIIFENAYLDDAMKIRLCEICGEIGVDWVKTSTGYAASGATMEDLKLMRKHSPPTVQVKAAGGVRDLDALLAVRAIGVTRVGASRTAEMLDECRRRLAGK